MHDGTFSHSSNALRWAAASIGIEDYFVFCSPAVFKLCLFLSYLSRLGLILDSASGDGLSDSCRAIEIGYCVH